MQDREPSEISPTSNSLSPNYRITVSKELYLNSDRVKSICSLKIFIKLIVTLSIVFYISIASFSLQAAQQIAVNPSAEQPSGIVRTYQGHNDVAYILASDQTKIYRWSLVEEKYLSPLVVAAQPDYLTHSPHTNRLYLGYSVGRVEYIELTNPATTTEFITTPESLCELEIADVYVFVCVRNSTLSGPASRLFSYDEEANLMSQKPDPNVNLYREVPSEYIWNQQNYRLYALRNSNSDVLYYEQMERRDRIADDEVINWTHNDVIDPIRVSTRGRYLISGGGALFDARTLEFDRAIVAPALGINYTDAIWWNENLFTIRADGGSTLLEHWDAAFLVHDSDSIPGDPVAVFETDNALYILVDNQGIVSPWRYTPELIDTDSDGVIDFTDDFPVDISQWSEGKTFPTTLDSDQDGVPDTDDIWPNDSFASLDTDNDGIPNHIDHDDDGDTFLDLKDPLPLDPTAVPTDVSLVTRSQDTLFMLGAEDAVIYRWSLVTEGYLDPIFIATNPNHMVFSSDNNVLYLGYSSGEITQIDIDTLPLLEQPWATTPFPICYLEMADEKIFVCNNPSFGDATFRMYDLQGNLLDKTDNLTLGDIPLYNRTFVLADEYAWSSSKSRVYYVGRYLSPRDIYYMPFFNNSTFSIGAVDSSLHSSGPFPKSSVRLAENEDRLVVGGGTIFDADNLNTLGKLELTQVNSLHINPLTDMLWWNENVIGIHDASNSVTGENVTVVEHWGADYLPSQTFTLVGKPLRVVERDNDFLIMTS